MKILLVDAFEIGENPFVPDWLMQPLGLLYLAGALREKGYPNVRILDTKLFRNIRTELNWAMRDFKPDIVGFHTFSASADFAHQLIKLVKILYPKTITVAGGPHANANPKGMIGDKYLDYIVLNEGERTFPELVECLEKNRDPAKVEGIAFMRGEETVFTPPREFIHDLDSIPLPAWDLTSVIPYQPRYYDNYNRLNYVQVRENCMPLFTSRACPYHCIYCHKIFGKKYRSHSPERVLTEIDILYNDYQIRQFDFYDDIFNMDKNRVNAILSGIAERRKKGMDIKLSFFNGLRGDIQSPQLIDLYKDAGTFMIPYAVETGSPRLQKLIKKNIRLKKLKEIVARTSQAGIITVGFCMLGFPTETGEEIQETVDYMLSAEFDSVEFFIVSPYYGTELAEILLRENPGISESEFKGSNYLKPQLALSEIPPEDLKEIHTKAYMSWLKDTKRIKGLIQKIEFHRKN